MKRETLCTNLDAGISGPEILRFGIRKSEVVKPESETLVNSKSEAELEIRDEITGFLPIFNPQTRMCEPGNYVNPIVWVTSHLAKVIWLNFFVESMGLFF